MRVYVEMILVSILSVQKERTMFTIDVEFGVVSSSLVPGRISPILDNHSSVLGVCSISSPATTRSGRKDVKIPSSSVTVPKTIRLPILY